MVGELGIFGNVVSNLNQLGFYGFVLPWLLVFAIVYGVLKKAGTFDDRVNGAIAFVIAFLITAYSGIGQFFIALSGLGATILAVLLMCILFAVMVGFKVENLTKGENLIFLLILALIVFWVAGGEAVTGIRLTGEAWAAIFMIVLVALAMIFVTGSAKS